MKPILAALAVLLCACAETPLLPPDSPSNPASTAAPAAAGDVPMVLASALPAVGTGPAVAPAVDPGHHHHHDATPAPEAAPEPGKGTTDKAAPAPEKGTVDKAAPPAGKGTVDKAAPPAGKGTPVKPAAAPAPSPKEDTYP